MPPARLNGQRFFLTYAQSENLSTEAISDFLQSHPNFDWSETVRELHRDGGVHFHAVVAYKKRVQRLTSSFDLDGRHPNILVTRRGKQLRDRRLYLRKDLGEGEDVTARGTPPDLEEAERLSWSDCLTTSTTQEDFLEAIRVHYTKEYILYQDAIRAFASTHFNAPSNYVNPYADNTWFVPRELEDWVENVLERVRAVVYF